MKQLAKKIIIALLTLEARVMCARYQPRIVAITGSVGKTSTKDAVYEVFSQFSSVRKSEKSLNSEFGVPLSILGLKSGWNSPLAWCVILLRGLVRTVWVSSYPQWLILEVGADHPGDIKRITRWLRPDIVIETYIGDMPVHVAFFDSLAHLIREKGYLACAVKKEGALILNHDDENVRAFKEKGGVRTLTFGVSTEADIRGTYPQFLYDKEGRPEGLAFKVEDGRHTVPLTIRGTVGEHIMYPALAAIAAGVAQGYNLVDMSSAFEAYKPPQGRMNIIEGIKGSTILDDSYNSSPAALMRALDTVQALECGGKKIAVIGDMKELGRYSKEAHESAGKKAAHICEILCAVGEEAKRIGDVAREEGCEERNIYLFHDAQSAGKELEHIISKGDVVLVKGSQAVRLEKVVEEIMAHPEEKEHLLVRQEKEWMGR